MTEDATPISMKDFFDRGLEEGKATLAKMARGEKKPVHLILNEIAQTIIPKLEISGLRVEQEYAAPEYIDDTHVIGRKDGVRFKIKRFVNSSLTNNVAELTLRFDDEKKEFTFEYRNLNAVDFDLITKALRQSANQNGIDIDSRGVCSKSYPYTKAAELLAPLGAFLGISAGREKQQEPQSTPRPPSLK